MAHLHNGVLTQLLKKYHHEICGQMDGTREITLSEIIQSEKDKQHGMYKWIFDIR